MTVFVDLIIPLCDIIHTLRLISFRVIILKCVDGVDRVTLSFHGQQGFNDLLSGITNLGDSQRAFTAVLLMVTISVKNGQLCHSKKRDRDGWRRIGLTRMLVFSRHHIFCRGSSLCRRTRLLDMCSFCPGLMGSKDRLATVRDT